MAPLSRHDSSSRFSNSVQVRKKMSSAHSNPYQAPQAVLTPQIVPGGDVWQDRGLLVIRKGAVLPDRCVKCNAPAEGYRLKRNLAWHQPAIYLTILAGIL